MHELTEKRTEYVKHFDLGDGQFQIQASLKPMHYEENGLWTDIDVSIIDGKVTGTVYEAFLLQNEYGYMIKHKKDKGGITVRLKSIGGILPDFKPPSIEGEHATWSNIIAGVDLVIEFLPFRVRVWRKLEDENAEREIEWNVEEDFREKQIELTRRAVGRDDDKRSIIVLDRQIKNESEKDGVKTYDVVDSFDGKVFRRNPVTRVKEEKQAKYPVWLDADVNVKVSAAGDDGYVSKQYVAPVTTPTFQSFYAVKSYNYAGFGTHVNLGAPLGRSRLSAWIRFVGITIPQNATINSATLKVWGATFPSGLVNITANAKKLNNPANPTNIAQVISPATLCTNNATLAGIPATGSAERNLNVKNIVQELVNAFDYSNEAMLFFIKKPSSTILDSPVNRFFYFTAYDKGNSSRFENLVINYGATIRKMMMMGIG